MLRSIALDGDRWLALKGRAKKEASKRPVISHPTLLTLLAVVLLPRLPQHTHPGLRPNGLFPRQSFQAAKGRRLRHRLAEYLDGLGPLLMRHAMKHFRATSGAVEGLEAAAHEVHIKGSVDATAVGHNGDSGFLAAGALLGWDREAWWKTKTRTIQIQKVQSWLNDAWLDWKICNYVWGERHKRLVEQNRLKIMKIMSANVLSEVSQFFDGCISGRKKPLLLTECPDGFKGRCQVCFFKKMVYWCVS